MRSVTGTGLVVGALAATLVALLFPVWSFPGNSKPASSSLPAGVIDDHLGTINTQFGPLTPLDRDFARKVRLAGLWEGPSGHQAQTRSTNEAVKEAGRHLIKGHAELDDRVLKVGETLAIDLPNRPNDQQQGWLDQMSAAQGPDYDRLFANLLRRAHGKVFSVVAQVRASTRNSMIRSLADRTNAVVLDHITALEATGLVDFNALDDPGNPPPATSSSPPSPPPPPPSPQTPAPPPDPSTDPTAHSTTR